MIQETLDKKRKAELDRFSPGLKQPVHKMHGLGEDRA